MSDLIGKNLLFYSQNPRDTVSQNILASLRKNPQLDRDFLKICVEKAQKLPRMVVKENVVPVVVISGFNQLIKGHDALQWIQNSALSSNRIDDGPSGVDISQSKNNTIYSSISMSDQDSLKQFYSEQYNYGFDEGTPIGNSQMADLSTQQRITTYNDDNNSRQFNGSLKYNAQIQRPQMSYQHLDDMRNGQMSSGNGGNGGNPKADLLNQRLQMMQQQRDMDVPNRQIRIGGLPSEQTRPESSSMNHQQSLPQLRPQLRPQSQQYSSNQPGRPPARTLQFNLRPTY